MTYAILYKPENAICEVENGICYMAYPTIEDAKKALQDYAIDNQDHEIVVLPDGIKPHNPIADIEKYGLEITFHSDPSHGWAEIPISLIDYLGIGQKISHYSYKDGNFAYLEEDCDLGLFMRSAEAKGWNISFDDVHTNGDSFIRNFQRYI